MKILIAISSCRRDCRNGFNQALRDTWLQELSKHPEVTYKFFVGDGTPTDDNEIAIIASQKGGKDINRGIDYEAKGKASAVEAVAEPLGELKDDEILLPVPDDYRHIAVKVREVFRWALKHGFTNVFKCETDSYVVVDRLLKSGFADHDIIGGAAGRNIAGGSGWGISKRAMEAVVNEPINTWSDDCWFPTLLRNKGFSISHDVRYSDERVTRSNDLISTHTGFKAGYDTSRMYRLHKSFNGNAPKALITISSWVTGATNGDNDAIRETYATLIADFPNLDYRFFIGDGTPISDEDERRLEPAILHATKGHRLKALSTKNQAPFTYVPKSDEVVIPCPDGYLYLGHKTWHSHKWALDNGYEFMFQCFPDTFIHIPRLVESGFEDHDFTGLEIGNAKLKYPAGGNGYWTSKHAAELLLQEPVDDWAEDRWAGRALSQRGIPLYSDSRYSARLPRMDNDLITAHLCDTPKVYNSDMMREAFNAMHTTTPPEQTAYSKYAKKNGISTRRPLRNNLVVDWFRNHPRPK